MSEGDREGLFIGGSHHGEVKQISVQLMRRGQVEFPKVERNLVAFSRLADREELPEMSMTTETYRYRLTGWHENEVGWKRGYWALSELSNDESQQLLQMFLTQCWIRGRIGGYLGEESEQVRSLF